MPNVHVEIRVSEEGEEKVAVMECDLEARPGALLKHLAEAIQNYEDQ